jgi:hypothetical protein
LEAGHESRERRMLPALAVDEYELER